MSKSPGHIDDEPKIGEATYPQDISGLASSPPTRNSLAPAINPDAKRIIEPKLYKSFSCKICKPLLSSWVFSEDMCIARFRKSEGVVIDYLEDPADGVYILGEDGIIYLIT